MEFCDICDNMLYMKTSKNNKMLKYCKHCPFSVENQKKGAIKISETMYSDDDLLYNQNINKYLRFDPTLRRINDTLTKCNKEDCPANTENKDQQVLYIKYDAQNMKYLYVCDHCGNIWR